MTIEKTINPRTPEQIADACEQAAELLEGQWMQGDWHAPSYLDRYGDRHPETFCVEGALAAVLDLDIIAFYREGQTVRWLRNCAVYRAVRDTIREQPDHASINHLPCWNDAPGRSEQEILDVLHATAKRVLGVEP